MRRAPSIVAAAFSWAVVGAAFVGVELASGGGASPAQNLVTLQIAPRGPGQVSASPRGVDNSGQPAQNPCNTNESNGSCSARHPAGTRVTLTATADDGQNFSGWSTPECPGRGACTVTLDEPVMSVVATFSPLELRIRMSDSSDGRVTSSPAGINCPSDCREKFPSGTAVTLTATPNSGGHSFTRWNPGCEPQTSATCTIVVTDQPTWAGVAFDGKNLPDLPTTIEVQLKVRKTGTGSGRVSSAKIDCGPTCSAKYGFNNVLTLTAQTAGGSTFGGWGGVCEATRTTCTFPVGPITLVRVAFEKDSTAPTAPGGLTVKARTRTSLTVGWSAASDNVGVTGYRVYLNDAAVGNTTATEYRFEGLACGRTYTLSIDAADAADNRSPKTTLATTTSLCPLAARLAGVGVKNGRLVVTLRVSIPTSASLGVWRSGKRRLHAGVRVKPGTNVVRMRIPRRLAGGAYVLKITLSNPEGKALVINRSVWLPSKR